MAIVQKKADIQAKAKAFTMSFILMITLLFVLIVIFSVITNEIVFENETRFDDTIYQIFQSVTSPAITKIMVAFTWFGSRSFLLPAYVVIIVLKLIKSRTKESLGVAVVALCGAGVLFLFKGIFKRERPLEPLIANATSFSYPSGHSFSAFTFSGIIIYLIWRTNTTKAWKWIWSVLLLLFAFMIGVSRVYLHVHYASDVIAGFCLAIVWLTIAFYVLKKIKVIEIEV